MTSLSEGMVVPAKFADNFMGTDQDVKDITTAKKPETKWCLLELPKEQMDELERGSTFYFQSQAGGIGVDDGGATIATDKNTFSLEFLENSNSQFIAMIHQVADEPGAGAAGGAEASASSGGAAGGGEAGKEAKPKAQAQVCEVFGQVRGHLMTKVAQVNLQRVRTLLSKQPLGTVGGAAPPPEEMLSTSALRYEVAASAQELDALLNDGPYVEVDGFWRLLPSSLEREILDTAVTVVSAKGWSTDDVDGQQLLEEVQKHIGKDSVPSLEVLKKALRTVAASAAKAAETAKDSSSADASAAPGGAAAETKLDSAEGGATGSAAPPPPETAPSAVPEDPGRIRMDKAKVQRFQVFQVLQTPGAKVRDRFNLPLPEPRAKRPRIGGGARPGAGLADPNGPPLTIEEFASVLQELTGLTEKPSIEDVWKYVGNSACADEFDGTIHFLDEASLPQEPTQRLKRLLEIQSHWNPVRLSALIAPALGPGIKVDAWVLKWTRQVFVELIPGQEEERLITKKFG